MPSRAHRFRDLVRYYRARHAALQEAATCGAYGHTALGAWATSRAPHLYYFFRQLSLERFRLFVDLGSGDGIAACTAGLFTRALGIEVDEDLHKAARQAARHLGLEETVAFVCGDHRNQEILLADCLYLYPDKPFYELEKRLDGWNGTLLVYGPHLPPRRMIPKARLRCGRERLVAYVSPPRHFEG